MYTAAHLVQRSTGRRALRGEPCSAARRAQAGFTYIGLLIVVALMGIASAALGTLWSVSAKREKEQELLFVGHQYRLAIARYRAAGGGGTAFPLDLRDLVDDERGAVPRHHLRKLYNDPVTGHNDWELIRTQDGQIVGIASSSHAIPMKKENFDAEDDAFKDAQCYCDWKFVFAPRRYGVPRKTAN
jgi:type II secretory pathway pseudopilin PulG